MLAQTVVIAARHIMENHLYTFNGRVYRQSKGGPIGVELTGVLARIVMLWWDGKYLKKLEELNLKLIMYKRYVDDQNQLAKALAPGTRFLENKLVVVEAEVEMDKTIEPDRRTAAVYREVANSIVKMIKVEEDVPSFHANKKLPILDLEVWVEN